MPTGRSTWKPPGEPISIATRQHQEISAIEMALMLREYKDRQLSAIENVIMAYHQALDRRWDGDIAAHNALMSIEAIMGMYWRTPDAPHALPEAKRD